MSLELVPYKNEHALQIIKAKPKEPLLEVNEQTEIWAKAKETLGPAVSGYWDGELVGCGGLQLLWEGVAEGWCLFAEDTKEQTLRARMQFAVSSKDLLDLWMDKYDLVRVHAPMRDDFPAGLKFVEFLGFTRESGRMEKYYPSGVAAIMYSIVR